MTNIELARMYYRVFKGLTLLSLFVAAPALIFSIVMLFSAFGGNSDDGGMGALTFLCATFSTILSSALTFALALYFEKYVKENEEQEVEVTTE